MTLAQLTKVDLSYGAREILQDISLGITDTSRLALTGANGSGKTTLLRLIVGELQPDRGQVSVPRGVRVSYLPQEATVPTGGTLYEAAEAAYEPVVRLIEERERVGERLQAVEQDECSEEELVERFHELEQQIDASGYYGRDAQIYFVLNGLGFDKSQFSRPVSEFSGGWRMRIALARILLEAPELLLLDEPTNYLDLEARDWLVEFLKEYHGGLVLVSHDRDLLDEITTHVAELFMSKLRVYTGNFSTYEKVRHAELAELEKKYREQQAEIARLQEFIDRFRYNAAKASLVQSRIRQLEKIEPIELPESMKPIHFSFPEAPASGKRVLEARDLTKDYDRIPLFDGLSVEVERGEKVVVVGPNGAGKSTLLRILSGADQSFGGTLRYGTGVKMQSFSADANYLSDRSQTVLEAVEAHAPTEMIPRLRDLLGAFLFRGDDVYKSVSVLSGGEWSRLSLATMLLSPANLLILDEPTNHLDMASKDVLLSALREFSGSVVFVSHDRHFIRNLATRVVELSRPEGSPTALRNFPGDYDYYRWRRSRELAEDGRRETGKRNEGQRDGRHTDRAPRAGNTTGNTAGKTPRNTAGNTASGSPTSGVDGHEERKRRRNRLRQIDRSEQDILAELETLEERNAEIQEEMSRPEVYADGEKIRVLQAEHAGNEQREQELTEQWEQLESERASLVSDTQPRATRTSEPGTDQRYGA
jgi:ATP-binding cassette subfamily F protein 3